MVVEVAIVEKVGKRDTRRKRGRIRGPCDSDDPPCDFKYVHRLHASALPRDVPFGFLDLAIELKARRRMLSRIPRTSFISEQLILERITFYSFNAIQVEFVFTIREIRVLKI